jgi:predicted DNA-binding WGR domain protein
MTGELFRIELRAADPARNRWRFYRVTAGQDLLDDWVVRLNYGRIGSRGQVRTGG